jgi:AbrB family looped-hinge helix DNA binding protein
MSEFRSGVERRLDPMGRIVIPAEIRDVLGLAGGDALDVSMRDGAIVLAPVGARCPHCGRLRRDEPAAPPLHAVDFDVDAVTTTNSKGA